MHLMRVIVVTFAVLAAGCASGPATQAPPTAAEQTQDLADFEKGAVLIARQGKPAEGLQVLDPLLGRIEARYHGSKQRIYSARSMAESAYYTGLAARDRRSAIVIGPIWGHAQYLKGYALVELGRLAEGRAALERAIELSPANTQYRSELGHIYQAEENWPKALEVFTEAERFVEFSSEDVRTRHHTRALRGQGFALIEMGRLDEAESRYRRCLKLDAGDRQAALALWLIDELRARAREAPGRSASVTTTA